MTRGIAASLPTVGNVFRSVTISAALSCAISSAYLGARYSRTYSWTRRKQF